VQSIMMELDMPVQLELLMDSSSAKAVTLRRGPGRMRHIEIRQLWLQEECRQHRLTIEKVSTFENGADMFTKAVRTYVLLGCVSCAVCLASRSWPKVTSSRCGSRL